MVHVGAVTAGRGLGGVDGAVVGDGTRVVSGSGGVLSPWTVEACVTRAGGGVEPLRLTVVTRPAFRTLSF